MRQIKCHTIYKHYKGKFYIVEGLAQDADTKEFIVVYRALYGERELWTRKLSEFLSIIQSPDSVNGDEKIYRFTEVI